jgi:hypothetical protein
VRTISIDIPTNASGTLSVIVQDGSRLGLAEQREANSPQRSVDQVIKSLNKGRRNNALYVRLQSADPGAIVKGELLSSLPPSVLAVLEADRSTGSVGALRNATLGEWEITTEDAVTGSRTLSLTVSPN